MEVSTNGIEVKPIEKRSANWPIIAVAAIFVLVTFFTWYGTWFGRHLSDKEMTEYLSDQKNSRHVQQALWQIGERIVNGDGQVRQWYPKMVELGASPVMEIRQMDAMVMGQDNSEQSFHPVLSALLRDAEPVVRRNAALALIRFGDKSGHDEIVQILKPYEVNSPDAIRIASLLASGSKIKTGSLLVRYDLNGKQSELRSPLPGKILQEYVAEGDSVQPQARLLSIKSDSDSVWEALRGLIFVGRPDDIPAIEAYTKPDPDMGDRVQKQATATIAAIRKKSGN